MGMRVMLIQKLCPTHRVIDLARQLCPCLHVNNIESDLENAKQENGPEDDQVTERKQSERIKIGLKHQSGGITPSVPVPKLLA